MSVLSTIYPTLVDVARRLDPNGSIATLAEVLAQHNEVLDDMTFIEGNLPTGHVSSIRTGLPGTTWRKLNYGVQPTKSTSMQVTDTIGMLEAYAEIDKDLAELNGNTAEYRFSEDKAFLESMNQTMAQTVFYGDTTLYPERFMGMTPRFSGISGVANGVNVLSAGGSGDDNTSIWLIVWGPESVHGIYPKGSKAGFTHKDLGEQTGYDNQTPPGRFQVYRTHYQWKNGLVVRDWRYVVRICNIDYSALQTAGDSTDTSANILKLMTKALDMIPNLSAGRPAFYCNRLVRSLIRTKLLNANNMFLTMGDYMGKPGVLQFQGVPIRKVQETTILNSEAVVS